MSGSKLHLLAKAGVYSSAHGSGQPPEGLGAVLLYTILGAFLGLVAGVMLGHLTRFVAFMMGRSMGLNAFAVCGTVLGGLLFAWMAVGGSSE